MTEKYAKYPHWGGLEKEAGDDTTIEEAIAPGLKGWECIAYEEVEGSAVAEVEITGLDLDADGKYEIGIYIVNPTPTNNYDYYCYFNGDEVDAHYQTRYFVVNSLDQIAAGHFDLPLMAVVEKTGGYEFTLTRAGNSYPLLLAETAAYVTVGDQITMLIGNIVWKSASNVTSIKITDGGAGNKIGVGSRIIIHKVKTGLQ